MNGINGKRLNLNVQPVNKIKSESGVSILFALLVLLVCTVIASIILTASTASSGRTRDLEEMDQRYYSVMSGVNFIRDAFDGQELQIDRYERLTTEVTTVTTQTGTGDATSPDIKTEETREYQFVFDEPSDYTFLLSDSILLYVFGETETLPPIVKNYSYEGTWYDEATYGSYFTGDTPAISSDKWRELNLTHNTESASEAVRDAGDAFDVALTSTLKTDGNLYIVFVNNNGDTDKYRLQLIMNASVKNDESSEIVDHSVKSTSASTGEGDNKVTKVTTVETTVTVTKKTTKIKWTAGAMEKL